jgi:hypothetical protein
MTKIYTAIALLVLMLLVDAGPVRAMRELSDSELDSVTAGIAISSEFLDTGIRFDFHKDNGLDLSIDGSGSVALSPGQSPTSVGSLVLRDNAQGNLNAFINVNAVNSVVQLLINLNVNIHSNVGSVRQSNQSQGL